MSNILAFPDAVKRAETATTPAEVKLVMDEVCERLSSANSALAVDSAYTILKALSASLDRVYPPAAA